MQNISVTIPDDVATDLQSLADASNFADGGALVSDYIQKTVTNFRTFTAIQAAQATAQANVVVIDPTQITNDVTNIANPPSPIHHI